MKTVHSMKKNLKVLSIIHRFGLAKSETIVTILRKLWIF